MSSKHGQSKQNKLPRQENICEGNCGEIEFDKNDSGVYAPTDVNRQNYLPLIRLERQERNCGSRAELETASRKSSTSDQHPKQYHLAVCNSEATLPKLDSRKTVRPQKSCESYDSATSGMSWSSTQSGIDRLKCNSGSISSHTSFSGIDELHSMKWDHMQAVRLQRSHRQEETDVHLRKLSVREVCSSKSPFMTGYSFDENEESFGCQTDVMQRRIAQSLPKEQYDEFNAEEVKEYLLDDRGKQDDQSVKETEDPVKEKKLESFWRRAFANIRSNSVPDKYFDRKKAVKNKKSLDLAPTIDEIDPVYELLRNAASRYSKKTNSNGSHQEVSSTVKHETSACSDQ